MASSKKSNFLELADRLAATTALPVGSTVLIGLSGGVDSVVLLHLLAHLAPRFNWSLSALHVHHGISPNADAWADFCAVLCARYALPLQVVRVDITPLRGLGIEAAARTLRHQAFCTQSCAFVALAQHADDQVETLLLQLLRGAGVRGASGMPLLSAPGGEHQVVRPLLHCTRDEILDCAASCALEWIEDESNADVSYPRNFLRHQLLPLLGEKFPAYRQTLTRSTQHFAEAAELLDELARQDAADDMTTLSVSTLQRLSASRGKNLLRYFLFCHRVPMPQAVQLEDMLHQLCTARVDACVCIALGVHEVRRYRGRVYTLPAQVCVDPVCPWQGEAELSWPALQAHVQFKTVKGSGISLEKLQQGPVALRTRRGGEHLRPALLASNRTLKNLLQEYRMPPWQRDRYPLLFCGETLVCVPGIAIEAGFQATCDEIGVVADFICG